MKVLRTIRDRAPIVRNSDVHEKAALTGGSIVCLESSLLVVRGVADCVLNIPGDVVRRAFRLVDLTFGLQLLVAAP
jgi:hypothetical protein